MKERYLVYDKPSSDEPARFTVAEMRLIEWVETRTPEECWRPTWRLIEKITPAMVTDFLRTVREGTHPSMASYHFGVTRQTVYRWLRLGNRKKKARGPDKFFQLLARACAAAESVAIGECESKVRVANPQAWLARRARSHPGYVGWEPDALKVDLSTTQGPLEIEHTHKTESIEDRTIKMAQALEVLRGLGLANEKMLIGAAGSEEDTDIE